METNSPNSQTSTFNLERPLDDYIQLSPLGLFPHARGIQQVDKEGLTALVRNFNSFLSRLGRRFAGLPFYIGHPDVSGLENTYTDRKAYGWIMDLQVRDDGLYGKTKWTDAGRELIANGHYKFLSPTWTAEKAGAQNGRPVYRPTHLVSVGLTNEPNLPVLPLANSSDCSDDSETLLGEAVPLPEPLASVPRESSLLHRAMTGPALHNSTNETPLAAGDRRLLDLETRMKSIEQSVTSCERELAAVQSQLIANVLDNAIASARILPVERKLWHSQLSEDFHNASAALANSKPQLKTVLTTSNLPRANKTSSPRDQTRKEIQKLVNEKMHREGLTYHQAWVQLQDDRPELFEALNTAA